MELERRAFVKRTAIGGMAAWSAWALIDTAPDNQSGATFASEVTMQSTNSLPEDVVPNMIGGYGPWAANIVGDKPARLSYRQPQFQDIQQWRMQARSRLLDCLMQPDHQPIADVQVEQVGTVDGVAAERVSWQLPYGPRTQAMLLKPEKARGRLPAVLALHDHGGNKYFGYEKITRGATPQHPLMVKHQQHYYGGQAWANTLAKRGYVVLVHDTYAFASRRVLMKDVAEAARKKVPPVDDDSEASIEIYNRFASEHEHLMAKSLLCAGTTWPGVFTSEDQRALDYLCSRDDVDDQRVGCAGLSGGGLRTVYLGGLDDRIRCACCVGMMSTWRDYLLHKCHTHTWMIYIPSLPRDLDYPEILGLRAPLPTLVLNNTHDQLFTVPEMERADNILKEVFTKANSVEKYRCSFHPGPHKFDQAMQTEAFDWFDKWLT
ncbi:MAG: hypothetical protein IT423_16685 [Pirellulaceae bacterium]|nr:hypothetical protein [Pirellulaceae bacterium]